MFVISSANMIRSYKGVSPKVPASCFVDDSAQIIGDVELGEHASIWMNAVLRGDVHSIRVGAHSNVQDCSVLHGMKQQYGVTLGEFVTVGHSVTLHGCTIEDRCLIGMGSTDVLAFRSQLDHPEWRPNRCRLDNCSRHADSGEDDRRTRGAVDGTTRQVSPQAG